MNRQGVVHSASTTSANVHDVTESGTGEEHATSESAAGIDNLMIAERYGVV